MTESTDQGRREPDWEECMRILAALPGMAIADRIGAIVTLLRNPSTGIRPRALRMGATLLPEERLVGFIRKEDDDVLRNAGLEILKLKGPAAFSVAVSLLKDQDWDVALQSVLVLDHIRDPRAVEHLRHHLNHPDQNMVQAVITALGHLGDSRTVADLLPFIKGDPWLQLAAIQALGDLRLQQSIPHLRQLLTDMLVGTLAAEAIARIGGREAYTTLARHWMEFQDTLDPESFLGLIAHVVEDPSIEIPSDEGMMSSLEIFLNDTSPTVRTAAARCLLACGPSRSDRHALEILGELDTPTSELPACLTRRVDLCDTLLGLGLPHREWGFLLLAERPSVPSPAIVVRALKSPEPPACIDSLAAALQQIDDPGVIEASLDLYLTLSLQQRGALVPALKARADRILNLLSARTDVSEDDRLVLQARIGEGDGTLVERIRSLEPQSVREVVPQLASHREIVAGLPWNEWIEASAELFVPLLADVAGEHRLVEFADLIRPHLATDPVPIEVIRAMGNLGDRRSVDSLARLIDDGAPLMRAQAIESLGSIGGPDARQALIRATSKLDGRDLRLVYRALSRCATEEDGPIFREAASDSDWVIRMSCAEFLSRFPTNENLPVLSALSADPVPAVAQRVHSELHA